MCIYIELSVFEKKIFDSCLRIFSIKNYLCYEFIKIYKKEMMMMNDDDLFYYYNIHNRLAFYNFKKIELML